jgi:hypothetical protein
MKIYADLAEAYEAFQAEKAQALKGHYGTSEGVMKAWDTRGRGRKEEEKKGREPKKVKPEEVKRTRVTKTNVKQVSGKDFIAQRDKLPTELKAFLTLYTEEQYQKSGIKLYLENSGKAGFGLRGNELVSAFSLPGAHMGEDMVEHAMALGATALDCMGPKLRKFYKKRGFKVIKVDRWDPKYKPDGWSHKKFDRPNIYYMELRKKEEKKR